MRELQVPKTETFTGQKMQNVAIQHFELMDKKDFRELYDSILQPLKPAFANFPFSGKTTPAIEMDLSMDIQEASAQVMR